MTIPTISYTAAELAGQLPGPHMWLLDFRQLDAMPAAQYQSLLSADELARAQTFRRGRAEFIACRALVRLCLAGYTGTDPRALQFVKNASGKPLLAGEQAHWQFNLSHSGTYAALAVMPDALIGVDIEQPRKRNFLAIAEQYFHPQEQAWLQRLPAAEMPAGFFRLWTLKEAFFKAQGGGIATGLHRVQFALGDDHLSHHFAEDLGETERDWQFHQQLLAPELQLALAYRAPAAQIHWFNGQQLFSALVNL